MAKLTETDKRVRKSLKEVIDAHYTRAAADENSLAAAHLLQLAILNLEVKAKNYREAMRDLDMEMISGVVNREVSVRKVNPAKGVDDFDPASTSLPIINADDGGNLQMTREEVHTAKTRGYISAIAEVRARTGCGLAEARDLVEATVGKPDWSVQ